MKFELIKDIIGLVNQKKDLKEKMAFFVKGMIFLPFLTIDLMKTESKKDESTSLSASGDDIYPLF